MYSRLPSFVLGFHGCDRSVAAAVISGKEKLAPSTNRYDWLGQGIYFWENNPSRALEFATELKGRRRRGGRLIRRPAVIGAVIDLGFCLNLLDSKFLHILSAGYDALKQTLEAAGQPLPVNRPPRDRSEILLRDLDCAVVNAVHALRAQQNLRAFDTVRSAFIEGHELYPGATFREKNHIQICVRNPSVVKGYFWPVAAEDDEARQALREHCPRLRRSAP